MLKSKLLLTPPEIGQSMKSLLKKFSQPKMISLFAALFCLNLFLFSLPGVPGSTPSITAAAPDLKTPDTMGVYSPDAVSAFLEGIGPAGREAYQRMHMTTDLAFPIVYGCLIFSALSRLLLATGSTQYRLPFLGLAATGVDLLENFTLVFITNRFPIFMPGWTRLAQVFTILKFSLILASMAAAAWLMIQYFSNTQKQHPDA